MNIRYWYAYLLLKLNAYLVWSPTTTTHNSTKKYRINCRVCHEGAVGSRTIELYKEHRLDQLNRITI